MGLSLRGMIAEPPLEGLPYGDILKSRYTLNFPDETPPRTHPPTDPSVPVTRIWGDAGRLGGEGRSSLREVHRRSLHGKSYAEPEDWRLV